MGICTYLLIFLSFENSQIIKVQITEGCTKCKWFKYSN